MTPMFQGCVLIGGNMTEHFRAPPTFYRIDMNKSDPWNHGTTRLPWKGMYFCFRKLGLGLDAAYSHRLGKMPIGCSRSCLTQPIPWSPKSAEVLHCWPASTGFGPCIWPHLGDEKNWEQRAEILQMLRSENHFKLKEGFRCF